MSAPATSPARAPRRVLMTADAVGGVWTFALELAQGLARHGVRVRLAVLGPEPTRAQRAAAAAVPGLDLAVTGHDLEWRDRQGPDPAAAATLRHLARDWGADLVHVNGYREAAAGFDVPVVVAAHSCVRSWWRACRGDALPPAWDAYAEGVRAGLAAAHALAAPTASFLEEFRRCWGGLPPAAVIRNGRDLPEPPPRPRRPVCLTAGRLWDRAKGVDLLAAVAHELPWPIEIAGPLPETGGAAGALPGLRRLGVLTPDETLAAMAAAELFVAPARYEPFGLAVLEAAAMGCALVLSDLPTFRELWDGAARFVPPDDAAALRTALVELARDPAARDRLRGAARERARRYDAAATTRGWLALYGEVLDGAGARIRRAVPG